MSNQNPTPAQKLKQARNGLNNAGKRPGPAGRKAEAQARATIAKLEGETHV